MKGLHVFDQADSIVSSKNMHLRLLCKGQDFEVMQTTIGINDLVIIDACSHAIRFYYILSGKAKIVAKGEVIKLKAGDSFSAENIECEAMLIASEPTELIFAVNKPEFEKLYGMYCDYTDLLTKISFKHQPTLDHCYNTMRLSMALYDLMRDYDKDLRLLNVFTSALFHDVGKYFINDDLLRKEGKFLPSEFAEMQRHSEYSANMLERFGSDIVNSVVCHHERLDGSGYPRGLKKDEIPFCSQLIAVADSYEAMVKPRTYHLSRTPEQAIKELYDSPDKYNREVVKILKYLYRKDEIKI